MDHNLVARQFVVLAKKLRDDVRKHLSLLHRDNEEHRKAVREATEATKSNKIPNVIIASLPYGVEIRKNARDQYDEQKNHDRLLRVQKITMVVVALYTGIAALQWIETTRNTRAAEKSANAATDAAKAARDSVVQAEAASHLDQRAWVAVVSITGTPELNKVWGITVKARNSGRTFAEGLHGTASAIPVRKGQSLEFAIEQKKPSNANPVTIAVLAPNADFDNVMEDPTSSVINQTALDQLTRGDITEFVFGELVYRDVFGCQHWTKYCFSLGTNLKWVGCSQHNSADRNTCEEKE